MGNINIIILLNQEKKIGAYKMSDFTIHKDEARKQRYINRHKKLSLNFGMIQILLHIGPLNIYGHIQPKRKHINI
jgi:hypothetical protein